MAIQRSIDGLRELALFAGAGNMNITKACSWCKVVREASEFSPDKKAKSGLKSHCRKCVAEKAKVVYWGNPEFHKSRTRSYIAKNKDLYNANRRLASTRINTYITESARKYGVTKEKIAEIVATKFCRICEAETNLTSENSHLKPNIDHCHSTGKIRGLLCGYCNNLIGRARDRVDILESAIAYLKGER